MNSAAFAAYELTALAAIVITIIGCTIGYAWGSRTRRMRERVTEEEIQQIFPSSDPLEQEQTL